MGQQHEMVDYSQKSNASVNIEENSSRRRHERETDLQLAKVGKKAVLRQNFGFFSMLSLSATTMGTWEGTITTFSTGFDNGGYLGCFIGVWVCFFGTLCSTITMAEMVSMAPTAGGQYHWVSILAPKSYRNFWSYTVAWLTIISWQASVAGSSFAIAQTIQGLVTLNSPEYVPQQWHTPLMYWALALLGLFFNTTAGSLLPQVESVILVGHVLGFFATIIPLLLWGPKGDPAVIFSTWNNAGGWDTQGLSFVVGLIGPAYAFSGADSAAHMVEEVANAAVRVPQAMVYGVILNGFMGVGILVTLLFTLGNADSVLNTDLALPAYQVYYNAVGSSGGTIALACVVLINGTASIITYMATSSRATWAFARDKGMPGWRTFAKVDPKTNLPLWAIFLTLAVTFVLSLIGFGSDLAFYDVISLTIGSSFLTYLMGNGLLLWRRLSGFIRPYDADNLQLTNTGLTDDLSWGPWKLPEPISIACNIIGLAYIFFIFIFSFFPTNQVVPDAASMNWSSFMLVVVMLISTFWYYFHGRKEYDGPVVEIRSGGQGVIVSEQKSTMGSGIGVAS